MLQSWVLIYGKNVVEIETNFVLTDEQKRIIVDKLVKN